MLWWDRKFIERLEEYTKDIEWKCHMYMRYVDDGNMICTPFPVGCVVEGNKVVKKQMVDISDNASTVPPDERTAEIVRSIANTVCGFIQVEIDYPSAHSNGHMPILDLEVALKNQRVFFRHYRKPMANPLVIHQRSAMPAKVKRECLTNEVIRIMRNTCREAPIEVKRCYMSDFANRMRASGYRERFRREIIESGMKGYEKQVQRNNRGERPLYRWKGYMREEREEKKALKKRAWYRPHDTVLFCPATPGGELAKRMRNVTNDVRRRSGLNVKVVERGGISLKTQLGNRDENRCRDSGECVIHRCGNRGDCAKENVVYRGTCVTCEEIGVSSKPDEEGRIVRANDYGRSTRSLYIGETSKSTYVRGRQHLESLRNPERVNARSNAFVKHKELYHRYNEEEVDFKFEIARSFRKPLERQVWEGVEIHSSKCDILMNSKLDHYQPAVGRMVVEFQP